MNDKLLQTLTRLEQEGVQWGRLGTLLFISTLGYKTALHYKADAALRKLKLKHSDHDIEKYDSVSGRTFTYYKDVYNTKKK